MLPDQFWALTLREFHLKHAGFIRAENRQRALITELALMTGNVAKKDRMKVESAVNALRQYPVKSWQKLE